MDNKGFTLIEMTFVLLIISIMMTFTSSLVKNKALLTFECERIVDDIHLGKANAIVKKKNIMIHIEPTSITVDNQTRKFTKGVICEDFDFYFNEKGNINHGASITCTLSDVSKEIVFNLGSGYVYVRS